LLGKLKVFIHEQGELFRDFSSESSAFDDYQQEHEKGQHSFL